MGQRVLYRYLDKVGDGTGATNANEDYSGFPEHFKYTPGSDVKWAEIERIIVMIKDTGSYGAQKYGAGTALSGGITVKVVHKPENGGEEILNTEPIQDNLDWSGLCFDGVFNSYSSTDHGVSARWTFSKAGIPVEMLPGEKFIVEIDGDCSHLVKHTFQIQGVEHT